jgi:hypothetical protein
VAQLEEAQSAFTAASRFWEQFKVLGDQTMTQQRTALQQRWRERAAELEAQRIEALRHVDPVDVDQPLSSGPSLALQSRKRVRTEEGTAEKERGDKNGNLSLVYNATDDQ